LYRMLVCVVCPLTQLVRTRDANSLSGNYNTLRQNADNDDLPSFTLPGTKRTLNSPDGEYALFAVERCTAVNTMFSKRNMTRAKEKTRLRPFHLRYRASCHGRQSIPTLRHSLPWPHPACDCAWESLVSGAALLHARLAGRSWRSAHQCRAWKEY